MSIRFPTDNDAGMPRPRAPRRPSGGGRLIFMLILGVVAFMIMRGVASRAPSTPTQPNQSNQNGTVDDYDFSKDLQRNRVDQGDWGMEDGPVQRNAASKEPSIKSSSKDWGMEEVATQRDAKPSAGRFSQPSNAPVKEPQNKQPTTNGDWGLDTDVETMPKPTEPKKTTNGDWGLEEVESP